MLNVRHPRYSDLCLSVTTITIKIMDGFVPNFMEGSQGEREDQVRVSL